VTTTNTIEQRGIDSVKLGVVGDFRDPVFSGGLNSYAVTLTKGDLRLDPPALAAADLGATGRRTQGTFRKMNVDLRRLQRLSNNFNLLVAFSGQEASKNLASAEKISLGGPNGVRAYPAGEATGDTGMILQTELRYRIPGFKFGNVGDVTLSAHVDHGWVKINQIQLPSDGENERSFSGYGVGISIGNEGDFIVRATVSERSGELPTSDPTVRHPRVWAQAVKWF
jgi:hemolysin activation/secretion protein